MKTLSNMLHNGLYRNMKKDKYVKELDFSAQSVQSLPRQCTMIFSATAVLAIYSLCLY